MKEEIVAQVRRHSVGLRIWHWLDAIVVVALITTFFLRESLVSHSRFLVQRLKDSGLTIEDAMVRPMIHEMVDQLWTWHIYFGYALTALFVWRVILVFTDKISPVRTCWDAICTMRSNFDFRNVHSAAVKSGYVAFYALQLFMIASGLSLTFDDALGLSQGVHGAIHEAHEIVMWFFLAFVMVHIAGVFFAENADDPGIVSAMINGGADAGANVNSRKRS